MDVRIPLGLEEIVKQNVHVWINGDLFPAAEARISVFDRNVLYGDSAFDTLRLTREQKVFKLCEHLRRFRLSAKALDIKIPFSDAELTKAMADCVRASGVSDGWIRVSVSRGVGPVGLDPRHAIGEPTVMVMAVPFGPRVLARGAGIRAKIVSTRRIPSQCLDSKIKQVNYLNEILAKQEAIRSGMDDALMLDVDGFLAEASAASIFVVKENALYTPLLKHILGSITRETIFEIAREQQVSTSEKELTAVDLYGADEAFLVSTGLGVAPLVEVDWHPIGEGRAGPMTKKIGELLQKKLGEESLSLF